MKTRCRRATESLPHGGADRVAAGAALLALGGNVHHVLDTDAAVATARQPPEREHAVLTEPVDELAGDAEQVSSAGGGDFLVGTKDDHPYAVGDLVEHRAHGRLDRGVAAEAAGQALRVGSDRRVDRVQRRGQCTGCHDFHTTRNCNKSNGTSSVTLQTLRKIRKEKVDYITDREQKTKTGRIIDLSDDQEYADVLARENALVSGHADMRYSGFLTLTAPTLDDVRAVTAHAQRVATQCMLEPG